MLACERKGWDFADKELLVVCMRLPTQLRCVGEPSLAAVAPRSGRISKARRALER